MTKRLDGTVALVTGASSGIGEATTRALAAEGASVAVAARRKDRLDHLAASTGRQVLAIQADLTDPAQAEAAVERTVAEFGRLDTLVNNAGVMFIGAVADAPVSEWDQMIALNVQALITTTRAALPHLRRAAEHSPRVARCDGTGNAAVCETNQLAIIVKRVLEPQVVASIRCRGTRGYSVAMSPSRVRHRRQRERLRVS
jgi:NADP-dependent 3-hydroxy acid dehydrogenase YdfG